MICDEAIRLIEEFEGCLRLVGPDLYGPYRDPVGIWTLGIGSIWYLDGRRVSADSQPISKARCYELMHRELRQSCEPAIDRLITVRLHPLSRGALASFCYNLGGGALQASALRKAINARRWEDVPAEFAKWRMAGGRILPGLVRRRKAESDLFMRGVAELEMESARASSSWGSIFKQAA